LQFLESERREPGHFRTNRRGTGHAFTIGMSGARDFEELVSWQRMHELNIEIWKATEHGRAERDFDFRDEIRDAADSAERNIAEGFGRYRPLVFANFLDYARASACETRSLLRKGVACGYFSAEQFEGLDKLAVRGLQAVAKFQRYLRSPAAQRNAGRRYQRPYTAPRVKPPNDPNGPNDPNDPNVPNVPNDSNDPNVPNESNDPNVPNDPNDSNDPNVSND
jgi:four helix bundle protein